MIGLAGPYDFMPITAPDLRDLFAPVSRFAYTQPIFFVDGQNPPPFLVHGEADDLISADHTRKLAKAVEQAGGTVEPLLYPDRKSCVCGKSGSVLLSSGGRVFPKK